MYSVTPGIYTKKEAAGLAAKAFSLEEGNKWVVCHKIVEIDSSTSKMYYKPVLQDNLKEAEEDGWVTVIFKIIKEEKKMYKIIGAGGSHASAMDSNNSGCTAKIDCAKDIHGSDVPNYGSTINPNRCDLAEKEDPIKLSTDFYHIIIQFREKNQSLNYDKIENYCMDSDFNYITNESEDEIVVKTITKRNANDIISDILEMNTPVHVSEWDDRKVTMRI